MTSRTPFRPTQARPQSRPRLLAALVALVGVVAPVLLLPGSATAGTGAVVTRDARNDVRVLSGTGLTRAQRASIDISRVEVRPTSTKVRYVVRLRELVTTTDWDQMVFVVLAPAAGTGATWSSNVGATTKGDSYAYYASDDTYAEIENCAPAVRVDRGRRELVLSVPLRCTPPGPATISLRSLTGHFETDAPPWSSDRARFAGSTVLKD